MLNLLDGLRDLKAPLASGMVTIFALWLAFANDVATVEPGESLAGNVRWLAEYLGTPGTLGLVAFVGYLLGLVLSLHKVVLRLGALMTKSSGDSEMSMGIGDGEGTLVRSGVSSFLPLPGETRYRFINHVLEVRNDAVKRGAQESEIEAAIAPSPGLILSSKKWSWKVRAKQRRRAGGPVDEKAKRPGTFSDLYRMAQLALGKDANLLAAQLQAAKEKTYEQYDKAKTEADFRAALVLPVLLVAGIAGVRLGEEGLPWVAGVVIVGAIPLALGLGRTALSRQLEANQILVTALLLGHIELPALAAVKKLAPEKKRGFWPF